VAEGRSLGPAFYGFKIEGSGSSAFGMGTPSFWKTSRKIPSSFSSWSPIPGPCENSFATLIAVFTKRTTVAGSTANAGRTAGPKDSAREPRNPRCSNLKKARRSIFVAPKKLRPEFDRDRFLMLICPFREGANQRSRTVETRSVFKGHNKYPTRWFYPPQGPAPTRRERSL
jgi:hypothetical protein